MYPTGKEREILYTITGQWTKSFEIREGSSKHGALFDVYDAENTPATPLIVAPIEQQDPMESRRAWAKVAEGIIKGDMDMAGTEKSKIENAQREMRAKEKSEGRLWERRYFTKVETDAVLDELAPAVGLLPEPDKTGGVWRFDKEKALRAKAASSTTTISEKASVSEQAPAEL